jgi:L-alanine-DL-glutamate epimerase-like enolase superfamily enzyme
MMDMDCCDIYEPEPISTGGIGDVVKICSMASARDRIVSLHCGSLPANLAISFSQSPAVIPTMEYLPFGQLFEA